MTLLTLENVTASYGTSQALFGMTLSIDQSEAVAMMGRNGMGKTTTVKTICRMLPAEGQIGFDGRDLTRLSSHQAARLGIGLVPEGRRCFRDLTVEENLLVAARPGHWDLARIFALFPRLGERKKQRASTLSGGEQQMLAIGRALMTNPRLLILDEATEGLAPLIRAEIWEAVARLKAETGLALLVIDKTLKELRQVADRAILITRGQVAWEGAMADLDAETSERYIGV
ncbi:ABC transporter ATP-binding protein [Roseibacterium beibuensis]|uniref:ABC transporter ATP-binding protein n=1 Tax=[Roseibacterium] beibuensis TaxID=1193142 RepID=A0ABP9LC30_9RHOB|nr:ABC transporter ATP-binding protein [Roseibacterium beibuensis]MCS6623277.1 ABC transporter ATP-binding protein [Roseibacterium beibuensis]